MLSMTLRPCSGQPCFQGSTWPKVFGYGKSDTEVLSIDRRKQDGLLAMTVATGEADLVGNVGGYANTLMVLALDPDTDIYIWAKVVKQWER